MISDFSLAAGLGNRHYLKASGIGNDRPVPAHERANAAEFLEHTSAEIAIQMIGVYQEPGCVSAGNIGGIECFDNRLSCVGKENWPFFMKIHRQLYLKI